MGIGLSEAHGIPSVSIHGAPIHSNIVQSVAKNSKHRLLQHWDNQNLTHISYLDEIDPTLLKLSCETTNTHMAQFITKCTSNNLPTMTILQQQGNATTNLCPCCGVTPETIQHIYQCTREGSRYRRTASVNALRKWLKACNMDPDIVILLDGALLYIAGEINDLPQYPNLTLHLDILHIGWSSIILGIIPKSLARTNIFQLHRKQKTGLKWAIQLITLIWRLIYR